tara:strand:- start:4985 stop:6184 length:1200 start_codon:yes stop_codon:yes gene_type:complete
MSILQVNELHGPEWTNFTIRMDDGSHLNVLGPLSLAANAQIAIPRGTTDQRPSSPTAGMMRYNTTLNACEYYNNTEWVSMPLGSSNDGSTAETAATSAKQLFDDGIVTSGKSTRFIRTSAGVKEVYCDFDTQDEDGNSGWMLVAAFPNGRQWGGDDGADVRTTGNSITPATADSNYRVSCNFYDMEINMFRCTASDDLANDTGSNAIADWYYRFNTACTWKEVWAPVAGITQYYLSNGSNPSNITRCSLRRFDSSYNLKFSYNNPNHKYNNLTDYGYQGSKVNTALYSYGTVGNTSAPSAGFFDVWYALSNANQRFEWYNVGRSANYDQGSGEDRDGSLAITIQGANTDVSGQDVDGSVAAKIGHDDGTNWGAATGTATSAVGSGNTSAEGVKFYWWIK